MNFTNIRNGLNISQEELAILLGVSVKNIMNWEQSRSKPNSAAITLYRLIEGKNQSTLVSMVTIACQKKYKEFKDIQTLWGLISKLITSNLRRESLEILFLENNPQWSSV